MQLCAVMPSAVHFIAVHYSAVIYSAFQGSAIQYCACRYSALEFNAAQCIAVFVCLYQCYHPHKFQCLSYVGFFFILELDITETLLLLAQI